jgi:hypothetical protein
MKWKRRQQKQRKQASIDEGLWTDEMTAGIKSTRRRGASKDEEIKAKGKQQGVNEDDGYRYDVTSDRECGTAHKWMSRNKSRTMGPSL